MSTSEVLLAELIASDEPGFACSKSKLVEDGLIHLRPFNISNDGGISFEELYRVPFDVAPKNKRELIAGDILFNNTNSAELVGKTALVEQSIHAGFSNHLTRIRVQQNRIYPKFLFYWLCWMRGTGHFSAHATQWVSQAAFKSSELKQMTIRLPSLSEQNRIIDILSRAEGIVRLRREAQKKAAEIIPALFIDMFGDPATNPKRWPIALIGDVLSSAEYGSSTKASDYGFGIPFIRMGNVDYQGYTDLSNLKYVELPSKEVEKYSLSKGDILFNRTNSKELVGKTGIWTGSCDAVVASYFIRLRVKREIMNPYYLWAFLNTAYMKRVLFETARGAIGQSNINAKELKAFNIGLPPIELQNSFELRCRDLFGMKEQQTLATEKAKAAFYALLARNM